MNRDKIRKQALTWSVDWIAGREMALDMNFVLIDFQDIRSGGFGTMGLVQLLRKRGHQAHVIAGSSISEVMEDKEKLFDALTRLEPNAIGLSVMTPHADWVNRVSQLCRAWRWSVPIILGGYHSTVFSASELFSFHPDLDYIVHGDADVALPALIEMLSAGGGPMPVGVTARGQVGAAAIQSLDGKHMDASRVPLWDEEAIDRSYYDPARISGHGILPVPSRYVLYSRGCPYTCKFCQLDGDNGFRSKVKFYDADTIVDHLTVITAKYGLKSVSFLDDNFTINKKWAAGICENLISRGPRISWWAQVRADLYDHELMKLMYAAGCRVVTITIESGSERIRRMVLGKSISNEQILAAYDGARSLGLVIQGTLLLGNPTETEADLDESIAFLRRADPDYAGILMMTPIPGTEIYNTYRDRIRWTEFRDFEIARQPELLGRSDVRLMFHQCRDNVLLERFHQIRAEYDYNVRRHRWAHLT
ncbi:radical SAM protein [Magnetospirillum sp. SS-4]|uniref:B12-binding domain-containing radical SAM protein n=1 Tax=Magnetospirillum sp. SS-4 TaxID=2681465 RepID=UPI001381D65C|nr:radical SAM protein [Magnetospirillum sp. SS-4]CAA7615496.1 hypothetical protein MTBSS4_130036 [Magnetospirillum sp. SS-4]